MKTPEELEVLAAESVANDNHLKDMNPDEQYHHRRGFIFGYQQAEQKQSDFISHVSGSEYLYDTIGKKEVQMWYKDTNGNPLIDLDPYGVDMGGKRQVRYADEKRYEIRYH